MSDPIVGLPTHSARSGTPAYALGKAYCDAVTQAGGVPLALPLLEDRRLRRLYDLIDGLLLCGGGDVHPQFYGRIDTGQARFVDRRRDRVELFLARWALADGLPILAICRGIQVLNVAAGGTLIQDIPTELTEALPHASDRHFPHDHLAHQVLLEPGTLLVRVLALERLTVKVNSRHHQAVKELASGFLVSARAPDGIVEAIERRPSPSASFCLGVQWHPENLVPQHVPMRRLFRRFVDACRP